MALSWIRRDARVPPCFNFPPTSITTTSGSRRLATASGDDFSGGSAYEVLGVPETSSFSDIKASFRKLAKETHPDVSPDPVAASHRFLQILAAYEILSDNEKRAHYDGFLLSQRQTAHKQAGLGSSTVHVCRCSSVSATSNQNEVVEWLKWYRLAVDDIVLGRRIASGPGYFGELENELYSAIRAAYYGPAVESTDYLPDCFEAEERSTDKTSELLHLVCGRQLLGVVHMADKVLQLTRGRVEKFVSAGSDGSPASRSVCRPLKDTGAHGLHVGHWKSHVPDAYRDLEVHVFGKRVASAARIPPNIDHSEDPGTDSDDQIHVFLSRHGDDVHTKDQTPKGFASSETVEQKVLLGTIRGLGTSPDEGTCFVYDRNGVKTHMIMKHRTLLVKHMHWYHIGDEISACECRCSRARLPPSRFWLFEPRSCIHDIGGWYIEMFGRNKKDKIVPSRRRWDWTMEHHEKRLHPAMYLVAIAYRTLDLEDAKRSKLISGIIGHTVSNILLWCKKLV